MSKECLIKMFSNNWELREAGLKQFTQEVMFLLMPEFTSRSVAGLATGGCQDILKFGKFWNALVLSWPTVALTKQSGFIKQPWLVCNESVKI